MISEDVFGNVHQKDLKYNKEESKGKRSSSEDVIHPSDKPKSDKIADTPYMNAIKVNDTFEGKS